MMPALKARWAALAPRQQRVVAIGAAILSLALLIAFVWLPLERTRSQLQQRLPALQQELAVMQRDAEEARRLRSLPATISGSARVLDITALRAQFPGAEVNALDGGRYRIALADAGFARWLDGVRALNGQLSIAELNATRTGDKLRVDAVLQPAKPTR